MNAHLQTPAAPSEVPIRARFRWSRLHLWLLVFSYGALYVAIAILAEAFVLTPDVMEEAWSSELSGTDFEFAVRQRDRWRLLGYLLTPLVVVVKIGFTAFCLSVGCSFALWEVRFRDLFGSAARAEAVFAVAAVIHLLSVLFIIDIESASDYSTFYPLSLLSLFEIDDESIWMAYLLKSVNAFEAAYIGVLVVSLSRMSRTSLRSAVWMVLASYGTGMLLLVAAVTLVIISLV